MHHEKSTSDKTPLPPPQKRRRHGLIPPCADRELRATTSLPSATTQTSGLEVHHPPRGKNRSAWTCQRTRREPGRLRIGGSNTASLLFAKAPHRGRERRTRDERDGERDSGARSCRNSPPQRRKQTPQQRLVSCKHAVERSVCRRGRAGRRSGRRVNDGFSLALFFFVFQSLCGVYGCVREFVERALAAAAPRLSAPLVSSFSTNMIGCPRAGLAFFLHRHPPGRHPRYF